MAVKEEIIITAKAQTGDAEQGLKKLGDEADKLKEAQEGLASASGDASKETTKTADAAEAAAKAMAEANSKVEALTAEVERLKQQWKESQEQTNKNSKATDTAGDKFTEAAGKARKLSEQLREVADRADEAAGSMVEKIGGPKAVAAIGTAAVGFAAVKEAVEAFNDSAEKMFRGFGEDGQKVWDNVERSLFKIKGAFAETLLGTTDMIDAGAKMKVMYEAVYVAFKALLSPIGWLKDALLAVVPLENLYSDELESTAEALKRRLAMEKGGVDATLASSVANKEAEGTLKNLYQTINPYIKTRKELVELERQQKVAVIETQRAEVEQHLNRVLVAAASVKADQERAEIRKNVLKEIRDRAEEEYGFADNAQQLIQKEMDKAEESGEVYRKVTDKMIIRNAAIKASLNADWSIAPELRVALLDADKAIAEAKRRNTAESMGDLMFGVDNENRANTAGIKVGKSAASGLMAGLSEGVEESASATLQGMFSSTSNLMVGLQDLLSDTFQDTREEFYDFSAMPKPHTNFLTKLELEKPKDVELKIQGLNQFLDDADAAVEALKPVNQQMKALTDQAKNIALEQLSRVPTELGRAWGQAKAQGTDAGDALAEAASSLIAQMASEWGNFFVKQGIAMFFTNPAAGIGLIAAGTALSALAGYVGAEPAPAATGDDASAEASSTAVTSMGPGQQTFGYFEGGRSPVTIVTNDAASIRTMQNRLSWVAARGGAGV